MATITLADRWIQVDAEDAQKILEAGPWRTIQNNGLLVFEQATSSISLAQFIKSPLEGEKVFFISKDRLNFKKENLRVHSPSCFVLLSEKEGVSNIKLRADVVITVSTEDVSRIKERGQWKPKTHKGLLCLENDGQALHKFITETSPEITVEFKNKNRLDFRRENLSAITPMRLVNLGHIKGDPEGSIRVDIRGDEVLIDASDFDLAQSISPWFINKGEKKQVEKYDDRYVVYTAVVRDGARCRFVTLSRWLLGEPEGLVIDHINRNRKDNRRANLRAVTQAVNVRNSRVCEKNTSGFKGVYKQKSKGKEFWAAYITVNKRRYQSKHCLTLEDAVKEKIKLENRLLPGVLMGETGREGMNSNE